MDKDNAVELAAPATVSDPLTELLRTGAKRLIEAAVQAEFDEHLSAFEGERLAPAWCATGTFRSARS